MGRPYDKWRMLTTGPFPDSIYFSRFINYIGIDEHSCD